MKCVALLLLAMVLAGGQVAWADRGKDFEARQAKLDQACEVARQEKLIPEKQKYIDECVAKKQRPDRASCERFYADYGNQSGNRAPLYYDLPECVEAHEHRKDG